jgi:hypothetical protein
MVKQIGRARAPAYQIRVSDMRGATKVVAACIMCGHEGAIDVDAIARKYGEDAFLRQLEKKLRCGKCKITDACVFRITYPD